jgi:hypothetical protein
LFDKKLELNGSFEQKANWKFNLKDWEKTRARRSNFGRYPQNGPTLFKFHTHMEGLYHIYDSGGTILDAFVLMEWYYDFAPDYESSYSRGIRARDEETYKTPHDMEMVRELYLNYVSGPWTLRVGKQMVVWGETSLQRTADVTSFVNDLTFEWIWVPNDTQVNELPPEGTMYNSTYSGGFFSQLQRLWRHDKPDEGGFGGGQGGIRIRGFNTDPIPGLRADWDWTLIYYNGYSAAPTAIDWGQRGRKSYSPTTVIGYALQATGVGGANLFAGEYNIAASTGGPKPLNPTTEMFRYYRQHNFGATATTYLYKLFGLPVKSNVRFEFAYKPGQHFNRLEKYPTTAGFGDVNWMVKNVTQRDTIGYALEIGRDFMPGFITKYNGQRSVDVTFGLYQDWILGYSHALAVSGLNRGHGDKSSTSISLDVTTDWFKQELMTKFNYSYNASGNGMFWAFFQYAPGRHWRFTVLPRFVWSNAGPYNNKASTRGGSSGTGLTWNNADIRWRPPRWSPTGSGDYNERNDATQYIHVKVGYLW